MSETNYVLKQRSSSVDFPPYRLLMHVRTILTSIDRRNLNPHRIFSIRGASKLRNGPHFLADLKVQQTFSFLSDTIILSVNDKNFIQRANQVDQLLIKVSINCRHKFPPMINY